MLVKVKEIEYRYNGGGLGHSYMVWYYPIRFPDRVTGIQVFGKDEMDAYRNFKPRMYEAFGLTVYLC